MSMTFLEPTKLCRPNPKRKCFCSAAFRPRILKTTSREIQSTIRLMFGVRSPDGFNIDFRKNVTKSGGFSPSSSISSTLVRQVFGEHDSDFLGVSFLNIFAAFLSVSSLECKTVSGFRYFEEKLPLLMFYFLAKESDTITKICLQTSF